MNIINLPEGAVISIGSEGSFTKDAKGIWYTQYQFASYTSEYINQHKIDDVKIVSVPWVYLVQAIIMLQDEYGHIDAEGEAITFESVYAGIAEEADRIIADKD